MPEYYTRRRRTASQRGSQFERTGSRSTLTAAAPVFVPGRSILGNVVKCRVLPIARSPPPRYQQSIMHFTPGTRVSSRRFSPSGRAVGIALLAVALAAPDARVGGSRDVPGVAGRGCLRRSTSTPLHWRSGTSTRTGSLTSWSQTAPPAVCRSCWGTGTARCGPRGTTVPARSPRSRSRWRSATSTGTQSGRRRRKPRVAPTAGNVLETEMVAFPAPRPALASGTPRTPGRSAMSTVTARPTSLPRIPIPTPYRSCWERKRDVTGSGRPLRR